MKRWTNYVLNELDDDGIDDDEDLDSSITTKDGSGGEDGKKDASDAENAADRLKNDFDEEINESFNDDIICAHGEFENLKILFCQSDTFKPPIRGKAVPFKYFYMLTFFVQPQTARSKIIIN